MLSEGFLGHVVSSPVKETKGGSEGDIRITDSSGSNTTDPLNCGIKTKLSVNHHSYGAVDNSWETVACAHSCRGDKSRMMTIISLFT